MNASVDTTISGDAVRALVERPTSTQLRPGYEGCNISTSLGFKHINYLVEAAILEHFRTVGLPAGMLYDQFRLGFDIVEISTRLSAHLHVDDIPTLSVYATEATDDHHLRFEVVSSVERQDSVVTTAKSKVDVVLRADHVVGANNVPAGLERFVVNRLATANPIDLGAAPQSGAVLSDGRGASADDPVLAELIDGQNAFGWKWRVPYFYCHFNDRMQMSGFLRQMEEVVDLFLADRELDIKRVLDENNWIPVVTRSHIRLLDEVQMEEELYTVYTVEEVFKNLLYTSRMDCYVVRQGQLVPTATGRITHGYMTKPSSGVWEMVTFDERTVRALQGQYK